MSPFFAALPFGCYPPFTIFKCFYPCLQCPFGLLNFRLWLLHLHYLFSKICNKLSFRVLSMFSALLNIELHFHCFPWLTISFFMFRCFLCQVTLEFSLVISLVSGWYRKNFLLSYHSWLLIQWLSRYNHLMGTLW